MVAEAQIGYLKTNISIISAINLQILAFNDHLSALSIFQPNSAYFHICPAFYAL